MRAPKSRSRSQRNRRSVGNIANRVFESSGPDGKVRGTPQQIIDKYLALARDAMLSGDRVAAENFRQHAEHYIRLLGEAQREAEERREAQEAEARARRERQEAARAEAAEARAPQGEGTGESPQAPAEGAEGQPAEGGRSRRSRRRRKTTVEIPAAAGGEAGDSAKGAAGVIEPIGGPVGAEADSSPLVETPESRFHDDDEPPATAAGGAA